MSERRQHWLCVCDGGAVRSATLARMLKKFGAETLSVGLKDNSPQTLELLCEWADRIYVVEERMAHRIPEVHQLKLSTDYACGPDYWFLPGYSDLVGVFRQKLEANPPGPLGDPLPE